MFFSHQDSETLGECLILSLERTDGQSELYYTSEIFNMILLQQESVSVVVYSHQDSETLGECLILLLERTDGQSELYTSEIFKIILLQQESTSINDFFTPGFRNAWRVFDSIT